MRWNARSRRQLGCVAARCARAILSIAANYADRAIPTRRRYGRDGPNGSAETLACPWSTGRYNIGMPSMRQSVQNSQFLSSLAQNVSHLLVASHANKRIERLLPNVIAMATVFD